MAWANAFASSDFTGASQIAKDCAEGIKKM
jgi:hypothetical protein